MRSRMKNVGMRLGKPPNPAAEEEGWAPSRKTLIAAALRATPTGSRSAAAYQRSPTRQRTIRRSKSTTPVFPRVIASTRSAATKGPKPTMGRGKRSKAYRIEGHHESAQASTKNVTSGCRFTNDIMDTFPDPPSAAGRSCLEWQVVGWVAGPDLVGGQVAVPRLHAASAGHVTFEAYSLCQVP